MMMMITVMASFTGILGRCVKIIAAMMMMMMMIIVMAVL